MRIRMATIQIAVFDDENGNWMVDVFVNNTHRWDVRFPQSEMGMENATVEALRRVLDRPETTIR